MTKNEPLLMADGFSIHSEGTVLYSNLLYDKTQDMVIAVKDFGGVDAFHYVLRQYFTEFPTIEGLKELPGAPAHMFKKDRLFDKEEIDEMIIEFQAQSQYIIDTEEANAKESAAATPETKPNYMFDNFDFSGFEYDEKKEVVTGYIYGDGCTLDFEIAVDNNDDVLTWKHCQVFDTATILDTWKKSRGITLKHITYYLQCSWIIFSEITI